MREKAEEIRRYYRSRAVRARILEYCGASSDPSSPEAWTAWGIAGYGGRRHLHQTEGAPVAVPREDWLKLLDEGADLCRSLADLGGTLLQLDVDYVAFESPSQPYLEPGACFQAMEPVYRALTKEFHRFGIPSLTVMTGRGYHFISRVPLGSPFHDALVALGPIGEPLLAKYRSAGVPGAEQMGRAHEGAGRLAEFIAHRALRRLQSRTVVPAGFADVPVPGGGPFICLDLSAYGDPLFERYVRSAFSTNQKAWESGVPSDDVTLCVPRGERPLRRLLETRADTRKAIRLASRVRTVIPEAPGDDLRLVEDYRRSSLARFHREFDEGRHDSPEAWPATYDALDLARLPPCARLPLEFPNPMLLQPVHLRTVTLVLWAMGWHPRSVAGLIRSKYERDYGWRDLWFRYDAAQRADFYVRLFCGAVADGLEDRESFNCSTQAGRYVCPIAGCGWNLGSTIARLLETRKAEVA